MARKVQVKLIDDLDGGEAVSTVHFGLGGAEYEIDLSAANAEKLRAGLAPFVRAARAVKGAERLGEKTPVRKGRPRNGAGANPVEVRAWAASKGIPVSDRGRIPEKVMRQYLDRHKVAVPAPAAPVTAEPEMLESAVADPFALPAAL